MNGTSFDSFDDTLLVPRLPPIDPPRALPSTFADVRVRHWPWLVLAVALLAIAAAKPVNVTASEHAVERTTSADALLHGLGR